MRSSGSQIMNGSLDEYEAFTYKKGNISTMHTTEKMHMTIEKAKEYALKNPSLVGFSVESDTKPVDQKKYFIHFKEGDGNVYEIGKWHTFLIPQFNSVTPYIFISFLYRLHFFIIYLFGEKLIYILFDNNATK